MNLGQLLRRTWHKLGDDPASPKFFTRDRLVALLNEGCLTFREQVEDEWYRSDQDVISGQAVYTFDDGHLRTIRVAYDDKTVAPSSVQELQSLDDLWMTRTAPSPWKWTSQGQAHNKWRFYPVPSITTTQTYTFNQEMGILGRMVDPDGVEFTFNQENGIVATVDGFSVGPDEGAAGNLVSVGAERSTVWGVLAPPDMSSDEEVVPIKIGFHLAPMFYALWQVYEEDGHNHNMILSGFYRERFLLMVSEARTLRDDPLPYEKHVLRGNAEEMYEDITGRVPSPWPSQVDFGSGPVSVGWTRKNYW